VVAVADIVAKFLALLRNNGCRNINQQ